VNPNDIPKTIHPAEVHGEGEAFDPAPFRPTRRGLGWCGVAGAGLLGALVALGLVPRMMHRSALAAERRAMAEAPARVEVTRAQRSVEASDLVLPGSVQPLQEANVYARANGYVRRWLVDIGTPVRKGQVLAELEVPDVDEELSQGQAAANQARAQIGVDQATIAQRQAQLAAAQVNLDYTSIVSPVDGTVVSRNVTVGQTVAASFQTPTLFLIATDLTKMQVDTNVSESDIGGVKEGSIVGTVVQQPFEWGYQGMKLMAKILEGDKSGIPADTLVIVPTKVVDKSNVDDYSKSLAAMQGK